jgi:protein involved in polysaccharide export with SLBB domain
VTIVDIDQAFVIGNVLRPITIPLKDPVTVRQAIAMAGGTLDNTKTDKVRIVRQTPTGNKEIYVDLKAIDKRGAEDIALQVNDIVDVPVSGGKRILSRIVGALAPATALLPIRIIR